MKIALYIEDGLEQIVLTPESDTEKGILGKLHDGSRTLELKRGSFYGCVGGYVRHPGEYNTMSLAASKDDSTMIVLRPASAIEAASADETRSGSAVGESAVRASADAQTPPEAS